MNKQQAVQIFKTEVLPSLNRSDKPLLSQEWGIFTDSLCKSGEITQAQYANWQAPACVVKRIRVRKAKPRITRKQYMEDSSVLHQEYYMQFVTEYTEHFIINSVGMDKIRKSKCKHLNDVAKHSQGGAGSWIWDHSPVNLELMRELGEIGERGLPSQSAHTCVGKACARAMLAKEATA